jgi:predicted anti-sigma-YlaC factor YlaD
VHPEPAAPLTCEEAIDLLADYLDQTLGDRLLADLERHLADCAPCRAYLRTYRTTRDLAALAAPTDMPPELRTRLREFLRDRVLRGEI